MKLANVARNLTLITLGCFALSYGASLAGGINQEKSFPASVAAQYGNTTEKLIAVKLDKAMPATGIHSVEIRTTATEIEFLHGNETEIKYHLEGKLPVAKEEDALESNVEGSTLHLRTVESSGDKSFASHFSFSTGDSSAKLTIGLPASVTAVIVKTVSGDQAIYGLNFTQLQIKSVSGKITMRGKAASLDISTVSGDIEASGKIDHLKAHSVSGNILARMQPDSPEISVSTVSGDAHVGFHGSPSLKVNFSSVSGSLGVDPQFAAPAFEGRRIAFTLGAGAGALEAKTTSGDVKLEKF